MHERGACVFVWVCVFVETLLQCLHTHEGTMVQFVSVCTSVVRVYLCGYVCLSRHSCGVHTRIQVHMVHFVSVCTSVVRAYLCGYVCLSRHSCSVYTHMRVHWCTL